MHRKGSESLGKTLAGSLLLGLVLFACFWIAADNAGAAEQKRTNWTPPTHCDDDRAELPIPSVVTIQDSEGNDVELGCTDLERYRLQCSVDDAGPPYDDLEWFIDAPATSDLREYAPGDYFCRLSVSNLGKDNAEQFSRWSEELFFSISLPRLEIPPNPPTGITVESVTD